MHTIYINGTYTKKIPKMDDQKTQEKAAVQLSL